MAQTKLAFKDMGVKMWGTGKGFAKVGAVYSGIECCVEGVRFFFPSFFSCGWDKGSHWAHVYDSTERRTTFRTLSTQE